MLRMMNKNPVSPREEPMLSKMSMPVKELTPKTAPHQRTLPSAASAIPVIIMAMGFRVFWCATASSEAVLNALTIVAANDILFPFFIFNCSFKEQ